MGVQRRQAREGHLGACRQRDADAHRRRRGRGCAPESGPNVGRAAGDRIRRARHAVTRRKGPGAENRHR